MNIDEIKKLHSEDEELKKYIEAEADRRVNQARTSWEKELPDAAQKIAESIVERKEKEKAFNDDIKNIFIGEKIPVDLGFSLLGEVGADIPETELESKILKVKERYNTIQDQVINDRLGGKAPTGGGTVETPPLSGLSYDEILQTVR